MPDLDRLADRKLAAATAEGGRLRALVLELWQRTRMDWGFVTDRLATTFRKETWIGAHERRFVSETLYGLVRNLRRVDLAIARGRTAPDRPSASAGGAGARGRTAPDRPSASAGGAGARGRTAPDRPSASAGGAGARAWTTTQAPRDLERLLALLVLEGLLPVARAAQAEPGLDWNAVAGVDAAIAAERKPAARIALAASLPDWLAARLVADWGDEAEALARALNERAPMTVRANLLAGDRDALAAELGRAGLTTHPGRWCETALIVDSRTNLFGLDAFKRGAMEAQDEGSQLLAELAATDAPRPLVVDYCAGAGGKTLAIAARLGNRGRVVATDVDPKKLEELRRRARRAGVTNAQAIAIEGGRWPREVDAVRGKADVVLVDAPCSGIGALRRNPEARWRLREADLAGFAARQREILTAALALCAPGGRLIYATCSLLRAENAEVVAAALASHAELAPVPLADVLGAERAHALGDGDELTVTPHRHGTDGFYARVLKRI